MEKATSIESFAKADNIPEPCSSESEPVTEERLLKARSREVHTEEYQRIARSLGIGGMPSDTLPANKLLLIKVNSES